jgi:hypothetical protein
MQKITVEKITVNERMLYGNSAAELIERFKHTNKYKWLRNHKYEIKLFTHRSPDNGTSSVVFVAELTDEHATEYIMRFA